MLRNQIEQARERGNQDYARGDFSKAVEHYSQAILKCTQLYGLPVDETTAKITASNSILLSLSNIFSTSSQQQLFTDNSKASVDSSSDSNIKVQSEQDNNMNLHIIYSNRSVSFLSNNQYEDSLSDASICIKLKPNWAKGYYRKAEALVALRRMDEALPAYFKALKLYENNQTDRKSTNILKMRIKYASYCLEDQSRNIRIIQLLAGKDFAVSSWSPISKIIFNYAKMMQNHVYIIACEITRKCVVVDICWDVDGVLQRIKKEGYELTAAIVTHYHFDHVGGKPPKPYDQYKIKVDGLEKLLRKLPNIKAFIHASDIPELLNSNDIALSRIEPTGDGFQMKVGTSVSIKFLHTPGHTPGSQCLLVNENRLLSGDTLFIGSVGRLDFPDSDTTKMYKSMEKLRNLHGDIMIYPGHNYGGSFTYLEKEKNENKTLMANSFSLFLNEV